MRYLKLAAALALLLALGCWTTTGPDGLKVELRTARTTFVPGDTFDGTITIRNTRANQVRTEFGGIPRYEMDVYDEDDSVVLSSPWGYAQIVNELELGPWGSESYNMGFIFRSGDGFAPFPVGNYKVRVRLSGYPEPHDDLSIRVE
jgi:hypothetical protein